MKQQHASVFGTDSGFSTASNNGTGEKKESLIAQQEAQHILPQYRTRFGQPFTKTKDTLPSRL